MQADLLMGVGDNTKIAGKNSKDSNIINGSNLNDDSKKESFYEIVSEITKDADKKTINNKDVKKVLKELIEDKIDPSMISELLPLIDSLKEMVGYEDQKEKLDAFLSTLEKMTGYNSNFASCFKDGSIINNNMVASSDSELAVADILDEGIKKRILQNFEKQSQISENRNGKITTQNSMVGSTFVKSDANNGSQKNDLNTAVITKNGENTEAVFFGNQASENERNKNIAKKYFLQGDEGKQNASETSKSMLKLDDVIDGSINSRENKQQSGQYKNLAGNDMNFSASLDEDLSETLKNIEQKKNADLSDFDPKYSRSATDENNPQKGSSMHNDAKIQILNDLELDNGGDSTPKLNSEKLTPTVAETKTSTRPQQLNQTEIIQQIVERAKLSTNKDHNEITIKLKPEVLGNIRLNISAEKHHVIIKVVADSAAVKEILENNLHHLKSGFVNQGLEIGSFDVMVGDEPQNFYKGQNFSGFQRGRRHSAESKKFVLTDTEEDSEPIASSPHRLAFEKDRIDYYV